MTRMLDRLKQKDLILCNRCPEERRQVRLALSAYGQSLVDRLPLVGAAAIRACETVLMTNDYQL